MTAFERTEQDNAEGRSMNELILAHALAEINRAIFAAGAPLGSKNYFAIREQAVEALKNVGLKRLITVARGET